MGTVLSALFLWTAASVVIVIDRKIRRSSTGFELPADEPGWGGLVALTILLNLIALPYYFGKTRHSFVGVLIGVGFFCVCFGFAILGSVIGRLLAFASHAT